MKMNFYFYCYPWIVAKLRISTGQWKRLFELIIEQCLLWGTSENMMFVAGATQPKF